MAIKGISKFHDSKKFLVFKGGKPNVTLSVSKLAYEKMQKNESNPEKKVIVYICNYEKYSASLPLVTLATLQEAMEGDRPKFKDPKSSKVTGEIKEDAAEGDDSISLKGSYLKNDGFTFAISDDANKELATDHIFLYQYKNNGFVLALSGEIDKYEESKREGLKPDEPIELNEFEHLSKESKKWVSKFEKDAPGHFKFIPLDKVNYVVSCLTNSGTKLDEED